MENSYSSEWKKLWNRWSEFEQRYKDDNRRLLVNSSIIYGTSKRDEHWDLYRKKHNWEQPSNADKKSLFEIGDTLRTLENFHVGKKGTIYPDVYAAACAVKIGYVFPPNTDDVEYNACFRGTRNARWPLVPSILRDLPEGSMGVEECKRRYKDLALFCEVIRQLLEKNGEDSSEDVCIGIAQHYGIRSPFIDLTRNAWVALFFASQGGEENDVGMVQRFFEGEIQNLSRIKNANFGSLRIIQADFVKRIKNQKAFFLELPGHRLDQQIVPFELLFRQQKGLVFEDNDLGVNKSIIYPSIDDDYFASFVGPKLKKHSIFLPAPPTTSDDYYCVAQDVMDSTNTRVNEEYEKLIRMTCDLHCRLQSINGLRSPERSINKLKKVIKYSIFAESRSEALSFNDIVNQYTDFSTLKRRLKIQRAAKKTMISFADKNLRQTHL